MRIVALIVVGAVLVAPSVSAKKNKRAPLNWEDATVTAVRSAQVYEGERDTSTRNDAYYGRSRSAAVYAPSQVFSIQTAGLEYQVQWTGAAYTGGAIDFGLETLLAGQPPNFSVGQRVQVAQSGQYLYVYTGGKKSKGYEIVGLRQVQAEPRNENVNGPATSTTNTQPPEPQLASLQPAAPPNLADAKIAVSVDSDPQGASIQLNGKFVGQTPSKFLLDPGSTDLIIQKSGFVAWTGTIELISGASVTLRPELKESTDGPPPPQPTGSEKQQPAETVSRRSVAPQVLYKVDPGYTEQARNAKLEGKVVLQFIVDTTGQAREIHVLKGLGMGLDEKAVEAVNAWKFRPGARDGKAVAVLATVQVDFRLRDK